VTRQIAVFTESEERKSISSLVNFASIDLHPIQSQSQSLVWYGLFSAAWLVAARRARRSLTSRAVSTRVCGRWTDGGPYGTWRLVGAVIRVYVGLRSLWISAVQMSACLLYRKRAGNIRTLWFREGWECLYLGREPRTPVRSEQRKSRSQ